MKKNYDPMEASRKQLARLIFQVRRHPLCPRELDDMITDFLVAQTPKADPLLSAAGIDIYLAAALERQVHP